jgi:hypothetical protein
MTVENPANLPNLVITNEEEAYRALELAAKDMLPEYNQLILDGWPTLDLYLKGDKFNQSITPTVMKGLIELQKGIYRAYSVAHYNDPKKQLANDERSELEISVKVNGGSSLFEIDYAEVATRLASELAGKMTGTQIVIMVLGLGAMFFGNSFAKSFLEGRKEERLRVSTDETQQRALESMVSMSQEETKRTETIARLADQNPQVKEMRDIATSVQSDLLKSVSSADSARFGGTVITNEVAEALTQGSRREAKQVRLDGDYRLLKLDWSFPSAFKVKIQNIQTGLELNATVQDESLTGAYKEAIKNAEWSRKRLALEINARVLGEHDYRDVIIVSAALVDSD